MDGEERKVMDAKRAFEAEMVRKVADEIPGYTYGTHEAARSPVSLADLELLKKAVNFTEEDERYLRIAGDALADQTDEVVKKWRGVIAANPHLAKYSLTLDGKPDPRYSAESGLRFRQWILDTCFRRYDQDWLNYQQEIALRHTSVKKNQTDQVESAPHIPLRYVIAFTAVINDAVKPFLAAKGHSPDEVERMHRAWCKSVQLQIALWSEPYADKKLGLDEW
jgi:Protoglobin